MIKSGIMPNIPFRVVKLKLTHLGNALENLQIFFTSHVNINSHNFCLGEYDTESFWYKKLSLSEEHEI